MFASSEGGSRTVIRARAAGGPTGCDLAIGHRRLSIIELSDLGAQPMVLGSLALSFNGEIYNYIELGEELRALGHDFVSRSDSEVLLHAWAEWGKDCLRRLNGIFAFLVWDTAKRTLFAARDRLGVKPLYYFADGTYVALASEIKALLAVRENAPSVDERLVHAFLATGRLDHEEQTMFRGIHRLGAGHWMAIADGGLEIRPYWSLRPGGESVDVGSFDEAAEQFRTLFHDSVKLQMRSDVPVACCLSGGLDSSSVVSVAASRSFAPLEVFTARFEDGTMDEWEWAEKIHRTKTVNPVAVFVTPEGMMSEFDALVVAQEEPIGGPGVYAQWCVMKAIKERGIRVVLDGQGGDELTCGYAKYFYWALREVLDERGVLPAARAALDLLMYAGPHVFNWREVHRYLPWLGQRRSERLMRAEFSSAFDLPKGAPWANVRTQQALDIERLSIPVLLRYEDKNSMANSIESRVPFLDHRLVELCLSLPRDYKIRGGLSKRILRRALRNDVPGAILERRSKLGFGGNFRSWVRRLSPVLKGWASDESRQVFRLVSPVAVRRMIDREDAEVFKVLSLDRWLEAFELRF
jgi:asparagine synthase (glutamine-hydrolysing)